MGSQCQIPHSNMRPVLAARDRKQTDFPASDFAGSRHHSVALFMSDATLQ